MKEFTFHQDMYDAWITYLLGGTVKDLKAFLRSKHGGRLPAMYSWDKRFYFGKDGDTTNAYQFHVNAPLGDGEIFYVWMSDLDDYLLWHETDHTRNDLLFTRGVGYSYESEEAYVYLGGWIFKKIKSLINESANTI